MSTTPAVCMTGRYQPLHVGHLELMLKVIAAAEPLIVAVTNPNLRALTPMAHDNHRHLQSANPFTYEERVGLVESALAGAGVARSAYRVVPFDLARPLIWRSVVPLDAVQLVGIKSDWERSKAQMLSLAGYRTRLRPVSDPNALSSSGVRTALAAGAREVWIKLVPSGAVPELDRLLAERSLTQRTQAPAA